VPSDWYHVNDFRNLSRPTAIRLPACRPRRFQADMKTLLERAQRESRKAFESEEYAAKQKETASSIFGP
jgi:hypothetical protein